MEILATSFCQSCYLSTRSFGMMPNKLSNVSFLVINYSKPTINNSRKAYLI